MLTKLLFPPPEDTDREHMKEVKARFFAKRLEIPGAKDRRHNVEDCFDQLDEWDEELWGGE